ncbi:MAG: lantibiotic dehydratase family protein, partial [Actinomycetes bacterium]
MGSDVRTVLAPEVGTGLYRVAPWVLVRTPLLPASGRDLANQPRRALSDPEVVRALAIGSPTLLADALKDPDGKDAARTDQGLARYLIRMSTRPTPYGAFAGVSLATWGPATDLRLSEGRRTRTRPDMAWLRGLLAQWENRPEVRARLRWRADPLAHESGDRLIASTGGSVRATEPARLALAEAGGWIGHEELTGRIVTATGGTIEQVHGLLDQLRTAGLLHSDLAPALTGADATTGVDSLRLVSAVDEDLSTRMAALMASITEADAGGAGPAPHAFARVTEQARGLFDHAETFQTDLHRELSGDTVAGEVGLECARAVETLLRIGPGPSAAGDLATYAKRFAARWGAGREVPLTEVFDPVRGLGPLPHTHGTASLDPAVQARRSERLMSLALEALRDERRVVELDQPTIAALTTWPASGGTASGRPLTPMSAPDAPLSLDVSAFVLAPDAAAVDRGEFTVVIGPNLGASVAGRWLGRFADLFDGLGDGFFGWLNRAEQEADQGSVPAEVVYLPGSPRSTNV